MDHAVIEADQFCDCGYNLHGQTVTRDDRLGFPVVRCPECGAWHPAGHGSTATRAWLRRLAAVLLLVWALLLLAVAAVATLTVWGLSMTFFDEHTADAMIDPVTGRAVIDEWHEAGYIYYHADDETPVPLPLDPSFRIDADGQRHYPTTRVPRFTLPEMGNYWYRRPPTWRTTVAFAVPLALAGLGLGTLQAAALWHLRWPAKVLPPLVVGLAAAGLFLLAASAQGWVGPRSWGMIGRTLATVPGAMLAGWAVGLIVGRPVARGFVRLAVPPRPRQALAHLWHADGRSLPIGKAS